MDSNKKLVELLKNKKFKLSTAESITGGKIISKLIEVSGASNVTEQSYIVYSNTAKINVLGVNESVIESFGVVSKEVALDMVRKLRNITNSDVCVATTGEAGPIPSSELVSVGTVCIGLIIRDNEYVYERNFTGDRLGIINATVEYIINDILIKLS